MNEKKSKRYVIFIIVIIGIVLLFGHNRHSSDEMAESENGVQKEEDNINDVSESQINFGKEAADKKDVISFQILNGETISVDEKRLEDTWRVNNKWSAEEIDKILDSLEEYWEAGQYVGLIYEDFYYYGLGIHDLNRVDELRERFHDTYEEKVYMAEHTVPEVQIGIRRTRSGIGYQKENIILANGYDSPSAIILSTRQEDDIYPVRRDTTTYSENVDVEYPVMYIKICVEFKANKEAECNIEYTCEPATIVITADKQSMLLIDGAFYTLKRISDEKITGEQ